MSLKIFALDVETTGLDVDKHDIHEISYKIIVNGDEEVSRKLLIKPNNPENIDTNALSICNDIDENLIMSYPNSYEAFDTIMNDIESRIDKFNPYDKFILLGYNVDFDGKFFRQFMIDHAHDDFRFGSYFFWKKNEPSIDVYRALPLYAFEFDIVLPNYRLETVCEFFGIPLEKAHDSMFDLEATIELSNKFRSSLSKISNSQDFLDYVDLLEIAENVQSDEDKLKAFEAIREALRTRDIA